jgi:glucose-1-phosphate adenylyltransferase
MVFSRARMLPPSKFGNTEIKHSIIAEGCIVMAASVQHSVVGIRSRIGKGSVIQGCYLMGNDSYETLDQLNRCAESGIPRLGIGEDTHLMNVIVDKDCRIGSQVVIHGGNHLENTDLAQYTVKDGVVVIKKGAVIADGFELK